MMVSTGKSVNDSLRMSKSSAKSLFCAGDPPTLYLSSYRQYSPASMKRVPPINPRSTLRVHPQCSPLNSITKQEMVMMGKDHILSCRRHALLHDAMKDPVPSDAVIRAQLKSTYQNDYTHQSIKLPPLDNNSSSKQCSTQGCTIMTSTQQSYQRPYLTSRMCIPISRIGCFSDKIKPARGALPTLAHKADMSSGGIHTVYSANYNKSTLSESFHLPRLEDTKHTMTMVGSNGTSAAKKFRKRKVVNKDNAGWGGPGTE